MSDEQEQDFSAFGILKPADYYIADLGKSMKMRGSAVFDKTTPSPLDKLSNEQQKIVSKVLKVHNLGTIEDYWKREKETMMSFGSQGDIDTHLHCPYRFVVTTADSMNGNSMKGTYAIAFVKECMLLDKEDKKPNSVEDICRVDVVSYFVPIKVLDTVASMPVELGIICPNGKYSKVIGAMKDGIKIMPAFSKTDQNRKKLDSLVKYLPQNGDEPEIKAHIRFALNPYN